MKKILFYLPVALVCGVLVYFLYAFRGNLLGSWEILLPQLGVIAVILASGVLLDRGYWFGCIPEIVLGCWFIYMGIRSAGSVLNEQLIGIVLAGYYAVCGVMAYRSRKVEG